MMNFIRNNRGIAAVEFAIIAPILILITVAVTEFGINFFKRQIALNGLGSISHSIQQNPADDTIKLLALEWGGTLMSFYNAPNFFCAKSYSGNDYEVAKNNKCESGDWDTISPDDDNQPYYVVVRAYTEKFEVGLASTFIKDVDVSQVFRVSPSNCVGGFEMLDSGSGRWKVPECVKSFKATIVGAGSGACTGMFGLYAHSAPGGAGGGGVIAYIDDVTPGQMIPYSIGEAGKGSYRKCDNVTDGESTRFNGIYAGGGQAATIRGEWFSLGSGGTQPDNQSADVGTVQILISMDGGDGKPGQDSSWYQANDMLGGTGGISGGGLGSGGKGGRAGVGWATNLSDGEDGKLGGGGGGGVSTNNFVAGQNNGDPKPGRSNGGDGGAGFVLIEY